ncbi:MAG TPA: patatin-like phospholipase family protein [Balneolales bacterium]|nr:patatin-like phospholipase family protein [Balneolales bacterium]
MALHDKQLLDDDSLALTMSGGGARAAYQVGLLRHISRNFPDLQIPIITGVSAGAINATYLASHQGDLKEAVDGLTKAWCGLTPNQIFRADSVSILTSLFRWSLSLIAGKQSKRLKTRGLVDAKPLRHFLETHLENENGEITGIQENLDKGRLKAVAISSTNYLTGQTITWTQGCDLDTWERINQRSWKTELSIDHVMASAALPLFFPAVNVNNSWFGDGGIRLYAPLSPAIHLGAKKILAISTRYNRSVEEEFRPMVQGYPPPAQIIGVLMNSIFLDLLDQDADRLMHTNAMLRKIPRRQWGDKRIIKLFILRPSVDLGTLAKEYEEKLPKFFRYFMRGQGVRETSSPDWLSMVLFQHEYVRKLIELGEEDADKRMDELADFFSD